jgi:23S rRNA pseudouridine2457 synthase
MKDALQYFIIYKPYQMLSQFSPKEGKSTLSDLDYSFSKNIYPVGRLDYDSEGLLILTNDSTVNKKILNPEFSHEREYWVQVENIPTEKNLDDLRKSVSINIDGKKYLTKNCKASLFENEPDVPLRIPPIRIRKNIPTAWLKIILTEGKNRQVRKMTAAIGFPTLRLIRYRIKNINIQFLNPGEVKEISQKDFYKNIN